MQTSAEWKLNARSFRKICTYLGPCRTDLFATRLNAQLDNYISWRPDPGAMLTDAFQTSWKELEGYAFPPFALIGRCLQKVRAEYHSFGSTSMAKPSVVSHATRFSSRASPPPSSQQRPVVRSQGSTTPFSVYQQTEISRLENWMETVKLLVSGKAG